MNSITLYKKDGEIILFRTVQLQRDKSILEIWGAIGAQGEHKFHRFDEMNAAQHHFKLIIDQYTPNYNYKPVVERFKVGIPIDTTLLEDDQINFVLPIYDNILQILLETGVGEVGDGYVKDSIHWFEVEAANKELAVQVLYKYMPSITLHINDL